jgi:hypothetical protein
MKVRSPELKALYEHARKLRNHHLSQQGYDAFLVKQEGICPVCKRPLIKMVGRSGETPSIDHNHSCCPGTHSCGKCIRGILHLKCNAALGGFEDNSTICRNAAEYLEHSSTR